MKKKKVKRRIPKIRRINQGYIQIKIGLKWIFEHRLVCENFIGRELKETEVVHHIDRDSTNNLITNLMIFSSQMKHARFHLYFSKYGFNQRVRRMIQERWKPYLQLKN